MKLQTFMSFVVVLSCCSVRSRADTIVTVPANPLWTDTGIALSGETAYITATGFWGWGYGSSGPEGDPSVPSKWLEDEWVFTGRHGQLIAFVGPDPYLGTANVDYYAIGSSGSVSGLSGEL